MASSGKFDLSSVSPDRPLYNSAQRMSYSAASLDRSLSFNDNMENPILSSLPSMSRSTSTVTHVDVTNFFQCLRFDPKSMAVEHKFNRHGDFKRLATAVLGSPDESPSGSLKGRPLNSSPDDLRRLKAGLRDSSIKARERVKVFSETLSLINKCFPSIPSRKRSRPDGDRSSGLLVNRAPMVAGVGKIGTQSHSFTNAFEFEPQKVDERGKNIIPNKRTRTSMVDQRVEVRPNTPARSSVDREKELLKLPNNNNTQNEDRSLHIVPDGWEKAKMKKKRTGIKTDTVSVKAINGYKEPKQVTHPRNLSDSISRLNDSHLLRVGAANGIIGGVKADGPAQQTSVGPRSSIPRPEQDTTSLHHDKRDRSTSSEKERTNLRSVNKSSFREEFISGSPTSSTKLNGPARGPRSGSTVVPKSSTVGQRATSSNDWDLVHGTNKNPGQFGSNNRKRTPATRSPSPPVAQWADRRPQKISRTARRTNLVPIISNSDEVHGLDNTSDVTGSESGPAFAKRFSSSSPQQFKSKGDHFASSTLSESEESGAAEIRSRDKGKKCYEAEEKGEQNVQKMTTLVPPLRKNKMVNGKEVGDGIRRQNRTGRGFGSIRGGTPQVEKIRHVGTAKQLRTARQGFDKSESKLGRPPTRKLSDRRAYTRQKNTTFNTAADFSVGSDDGPEELLAAAKAVINPDHALSSPFWRQMEPLFVFLSDVDISYLKQQESIQSNINTTNPAHQGNYSSGINGSDCISIESSPLHFTSGTMGLGEIPLCQRLLTALISEEGNEEISFNGNNNHNFNVYGSTFEFETNVESNAFNHRSLQNYEHGGHVNFSNHKTNSTLRTCKDSIYSPPDHHIMSMSDSTTATGFDHSYNGILSDPAMTPGITFSDYQYTNMQLNERLLLEIQSIGLYPELVPDSPHNGNEGINREIYRLEEKHHEQVSKKKRLLDNLLESTNEARYLQEKEFEQLCIDKLTAMAYQKYMSCWGPHAPKNVGSKVAKQAALGFVKRTLDRCHKYETTGKSCFSEPAYKEIFHSGSSLHLNDTLSDAATVNEFGKINGKSIERVSSGTQLSPLLNNHDTYSSDAFHFSEQTNGKDENIWSSRVKKRELYLDDVITGTSSGFGTTILNSAKGKRSERDREGKNNGFSKNGGPKIGRPVSGNVKVERKNKAKIKQKTTQLSASLNGPMTIGKNSDQNRSFSSYDMKNNNAYKEEDELTNLEEPLDFSHLQIPEMDVLGEQGEDIGSWLNIDDDILQDDDFMGLEIPMDDLSDLNMMV